MKIYTKTETELLQTIRKWEELCDESLTDAAYWKGQAQNVPELLAALIGMMNRYGDKSPHPTCDASISARAALAKAEGVK
jgi:hypothetical protein